MFFMVWGGSIYTTGWILRCISSYHVANLNLYIAETVFILAGPPIYSAAEYNILGRLMCYVPMHASLNPTRVVIFFVYVGAAVEGLTTAGAARLGAGAKSEAMLESGVRLVAIGTTLQAVVELVFMGLVAHFHYRCVKSNMNTRRVRSVCIMLYGTSTMVLARCIFRGIEKFAQLSVIQTGTCRGLCRTVLLKEWYLFVFEAAPMVVYTYWLNAMHPGMYLPQKATHYLDFDKTLRSGPGWVDGRSSWITFIDPCDARGTHDKFWLRSEEWPVVSQTEVQRKASPTVA
jgi:hypothetical protein